MSKFGFRTFVSSKFPIAMGYKEKYIHNGLTGRDIYIFVRANGTLALRTTDQFIKGVIMGVQPEQRNIYHVRLANDVSIDVNTETAVYSMYRPSGVEVNYQRRIAIEVAA